MPEAKEPDAIAPELAWHLKLADQSIPDWNAKNQIKNRKPRDADGAPKKHRPEGRHDDRDHRLI